MSAAYLLWASAALAADWTEHLLESRFVAAGSFPSGAILARAELEGLGPVWLQLTEPEEDEHLLWGSAG